MNTYTHEYWMLQTINSTVYIYLLLSYENSDFSTNNKVVKFKNIYIYQLNVI